MTELAEHAIEGPPTRAAAGEAGLSVPAGWPYEDPRFPPPAPAVHNGAWIDGATGTIHAWWTSAAWPSSWSNSCRIDAGATPC